MCQLPCGTIAQHVGTWANFLFRFAFRDNQQFVTGMQLQRAIGDHEFVPPFYQHHQHTFRQIHIHQPVSLCQHFLRQYDIAEVCIDFLRYLYSEIISCFFPVVYPDGVIWPSMKWSFLEPLKTIW